MSRSVVLVAALALIACAKKAPPVVESDAGGAASSAVTSAEPKPPEPGQQKRPTTTSWAITASNLDGQIDTYASSSELSNPKVAGPLVDLLLARARFVARIAD